MRADGDACRRERRLDDLRIVRMAIAAEQREHAAHVVACLRIRRNPAIAVDDALAGVVGGRGQRDFAAVIREQPAQIREAPRTLSRTSYGLRTLNRAAVSGMSCIRPRASFTSAPAC
jgi:hypothetical protein